MKTPWIPEIRTQTQQQKDGHALKKHPSHIFDSADLWCFRRSRLWNLQVRSEDRNSSSACAKVSKNTWPNHSKGGCPATARLCMCKLHLFRRFRRCGFCCRRHGLCGSLDISQHTDSHSKSSATSGCLGYVWDKQPLAFPTASALGKAELPSCGQGHFQLCTMSVFGATTHLAIILNQSAGL